jgi:predicted transcriptional regulator
MTIEPKLKHIHIEREGLEMFLGRIEAAVMLTLWEHGPLPSNKIQKHLVPTGNWAWQTIATTCKRLVDKGYLKHDRKRFVFASAFENEDQFIDFCINQTIQCLADQYPTSLKEALHEHH